MEMNRKILSSLLVMVLVAHCFWLPEVIAAPHSTHDNQQPQHHRQHAAAAAQQGSAAGPHQQQRPHPRPRTKSVSFNDAPKRWRPSPSQASTHPPKETKEKVVYRPVTAGASWDHATHLTFLGDRPFADIRQMDQRRGVRLPVVHLQRKPEAASSSNDDDKQVDPCEKLRRHAGTMSTIYKPLIVADTDCRKFVLCGQNALEDAMGHCEEGERVGLSLTDGVNCYPADQVDCFEDHSIMMNILQE